MVNMDKMDKEILKRELRKDKHHSRQWFDYGSETARQWLDLDGRFLAHKTTSTGHKTVKKTKLRIKLAGTAARTGQNEETKQRKQKLTNTI